MATILVTIDWSDYQFLENANEGVRLAWIMLRCYLADQGCGRRKFDVGEFATTCRLSVDDASEMIDRAATHGVIRFHQGKIVVCNELSANRATRRPMGSAWSAARVRILERDGRTCRYCGEPATSVDHVMPYARGGSDDDGNLVAACYWCNTTKGCRTPDEAGMVLRGR
jgi:hypothetical protein